MKLLIGGSPCTYWSIAQTKNRETEASGLGWELFKNYLIAREKYKPDYFLYENNKSMSPVIRAQITCELGVEPVLINSALVSAQNRQRLYWVGKREPDGTYSQVPVEQPEDRGILLRDILESGVCWREKAYTLKASACNQGGPSNIIRSIESNGHFSANGVAEPIRIGTIENGLKNPAHNSKQYRVYSPNGGGADGAATGLYAVPAGMAWRGRENGSAFEMRDDQKSNAVAATGHQSRLVIEAADGKQMPVYEVRGGQITIKGQQYPIKLMDGYYIIRKLTVTECKRLQTVPDSYEFPVSNSQAYKMLGNGWTVDVIAHIMSHFTGLTEEPVDVLSMYDGMSCGHIALDKLGAEITAYYATEIDKYAVQTTQHNFPDTVQLGDAFRVRERTMAELLDTVAD